MLSISNVLARAIALYPERVAVLTVDSSLTFCTLGQRVDALAAALAAMGVLQGDRVAVLDFNSAEYLECYYAAAQAGMVLVPINSRLAAREIAYILNDADVKVVVCANSFIETLEQARGSVKRFPAIMSHGQAPDSPAVRNYEAMLAQAQARFLPPEIDHDDICAIYYTSGTTGEPKGVCLTYRNMTVSMLDSIVGLGLRYDDTWMHAAPMFHLVDAWAVWAMPLLGAAQVPLHFEPTRFLATVAKTRTTAVALPPTLIGMLSRCPGVREADLGSLRFIMFGGSPASLQVLQDGERAIATRYVHAYGITETSGIVTLQRPEEIFVHVGGAGQPVSQIELDIVDDEGRPLPHGQVGEVVISGPRVMARYWNKDKATAECLKAGRYHTGDLGYVGAGDNLYIVDRKKDMIITGGENVYSVEVENALASHAGVSSAAVIGVPSARWGEEVKAIVVARQGHALTEHELIDYCRSRIAAYKAPKSIEFRPELPMTGSGKVSKKALRDPFWAGHTNRI